MPHLRQIARWILVPVVCSSVLLAAAILLLNTNYAHRYFLSLIVQHIQDAVGVPVEIKNISFHRTNLGADFFGIKVHGAESDQQPTLFSADRVAVGLGLHLFQSKKIDLQEVIIDRPVMHLSVDSDGKSNMPPSRSSASEGSSSVFDMAIGHFVMNNGEIFYNDRHAMVTADVRNLDSQISSGSLKKSYDGTVSYHDARIQYGSLAPFTHDLGATFSATPSGLALKSLILQTRASSIRAHGQVANYADPSFDGSYEARLSTRELSELFRNSAVPDGQIDTDGTVAYKRSAGDPAINALSLTGTFSGRNLDMLLSEVRASFQNVSGEYHLDRGNLEVRNVEAGVLGGHISGMLLISHLATDASA